MFKVMGWFHNGFTAIDTMMTEDTAYDKREEYLADGAYRVRIDGLDEIVFGVADCVDLPLDVQESSYEMCCLGVCDPRD